MKSNKYKILVLSDLKQTASLALGYAANVSQEIDADVEVFYVKKATEVIETESPLSAIRIISEVCRQTEKKIKDLVSPISKENDVDIKTTFAFGNIKNEIENRINSSQPDIIVLGERKQKRFNFLGDNITDFVYKNYNGVVLVATENDFLDSKGKLSIDNLVMKSNTISSQTKNEKTT
ncbi:universal stress protein [Psychroserpens burtonensis]|uniref:universal stress protein n=1 Tax=Psychroserpens burtonensis TaxID=49278 RepID=UPI00042A2A8D|nr:universal stress protein [Psychroserpens burtonensis]